MKAVLVINEMPESCDGCTLNCDGICGAEQEPVHSIVCPLKPLPQKSGLVHQGVDGWCKLSEYSRGWNDCLEEIEGQSEHEIERL